MNKRRLANFKVLLAAVEGWVVLLNAKGYRLSMREEMDGFESWCCSA